MNEIFLFTLTTFAMFAIWNESYRLRLILRAYIERIGNTWGKAKWVYSNQKETQSWMLK